MIIRPQIRGTLFLNAHPAGCGQNVLNQIREVKSLKPIAHGPKRVLILGSSGGYGLASRIVAAFGCGAATIGVFYERSPSEKHTGSAGWYNALAFENAAKTQGLYAKNFNLDAFSPETKNEVLQTIKNDFGQIDLVIYSVVAPRRLDPATGTLAKIAIKPRHHAYTEKTYDFIRERIETLTVGPASDEEVRQTVQVLGGEDWESWVSQLSQLQLLAQGFTTVAYSYIGSQIAWPIYRGGTIGAAKEHMEKTASRMNAWLVSQGGRALISVNKAVLTQASSVIPFVSLYLVLLMKTMRDKGVDESSVRQMHRLFQQYLYSEQPQELDNQGRIRLDDLEMRTYVQNDVNKMWQGIDNSNLSQIINVKDFKKEYLNLYGFEVPGVDYEADMDVNAV